MNSEKYLRLKQKANIVFIEYVLADHYYKSKIENDMLFCDSGDGWQFVTYVVNNKVLTRPVFIWMGY